MTDRFAAQWDAGIASDRHKGIRIGTLWERRCGGSGDCTLTVEFLNESGLYRADILADIIGVLQREYELAVAQIFDRSANDDVAP